MQIVASGRGDWIGWVELLPETVDETAIRMTAKVIDEVAADVLCVVEAESRPALVRMNTGLLSGRYGHVMLVDGNDPRGIDIGLCCNAAIEVASIRSHVDVADPATPRRALFSRDCPVYQLRLAGGAELWMVLNHLKSQSFTSGNPDPLRSRQSAEVRRIYDQLRDDGAELIAVLGDFNKGPTNDQPPSIPPLSRCLTPAAHWSTRPPCRGSTLGRGLGPSSRAAYATGSTTSCCPRNWRMPSPLEGSSARACGHPDQQEPAIGLDGLP